MCGNPFKKKTWKKVGGFAKDNLVGGIGGAIVGGLLAIPTGGLSIAAGAAAGAALGVTQSALTPSPVSPPKPGDPPQQTPVPDQDRIRRLATQRQRARTGGSSGGSGGAGRQTTAGVLSPGKISSQRGFRFG